MECQQLALHFLDVEEESIGRVCINSVRFCIHYLVQVKLFLQKNTLVYSDADILFGKHLYMYLQVFQLQHKVSWIGFPISFLSIA